MFKILRENYFPVYPNDLDATQNFCAIFLCNSLGCIKMISLLILRTKRYLMMGKRGRGDEFLPTFMIPWSKSKVNPYTNIMYRGAFRDFFRGGNLWLWVGENYSRIRLIIIHYQTIYCTFLSLCLFFHSFLRVQDNSSSQALES